MRSILLQRGSAAPTKRSPPLPSSLSHFMILLRDRVLLATALRLCLAAVTEGWGKGELRFEVGYKLHCALFLPRHPPVKASLRSGCFCFLAISLLPYLLAAPCTSCDDDPCSETRLQGASPGPPRGQRAPGQWETRFRTSRSSCLYFKALVERDWDFCQSLARGKVFSGSVHTMKDSHLPFCFILIPF